MKASTRFDIDEIEAYYAQKASIFSDDPRRDFWAKVMSLDTAPRRLLLMYNEVGNYRELAAILGVSHNFLCKQIKKILKRIR